MHIYPSSTKNPLQGLLAALAGSIPTGAARDRLAVAGIGAGGSRAIAVTKKTAGLKCQAFPKQ
ncbi:protein of unknown function [Acidithiobacillus ferrivorans]|uniref:Uncharacterized protein n=1 Tax=Acidithiobacillus ferrivorans TaxID=160808 RepID=A0A060UR88_9PROT|nr:exported hypothetical protein [Acidithiobacillus ferrivorans]SMH64185.1 protein of unknown function [Acidithiobacillus ferrivorans]